MALPRPSELSALGAVLCLYRVQQGGELAGWSQAVQACVCSGRDSDGLREQLLFFDHEGRCCWRICLLPDSDFLAWDELAAKLSAVTRTHRSGGIGERLWRGLAGCLQGERWQGSILRLHALADTVADPHGGEGAALAMSQATLSPLGAATARHVAREEGVDADSIGAVDQRRGGRAARAAMPAAHELPATAWSNVIPLFRFDTGAHA